MIEYQVLKEIESNPHITQRFLAEKLGISLGKVNYILSGMIEKGIVKAKRLKNRPDQIRRHYLLTPDGIQERLRLAKNCLDRRRIEVDSLKREIAQLEREIGAGSATLRSE